MYFTTHVAIGAAAGAFMPGIGTAVLAGAASHAVADMIPHHDYQSVGPGLLDVAAGLALLAVGRSAGIPAVAMAGAIAGGLPDLEVALKHLGVWPWPLVFPTHSGLLPHGKTGFWPGLLIQAAFAAGSIALLAARMSGTA